MKIFINSNYSFYEKSLAVLLPSIPDRNHEFEIIVGGSPWEYKKETIDGFNYHFVNYDNIDFTSFIFINEHPEIIKNKKFFLYIHDTTKMGTNFFNNLYKNLEINVKKFRSEEEFLQKTKHLKLTCEGYSMNMGMYRSDFNKENKHKNFLNLKNTDISEKGRREAKIHNLKNEDILLEGCTNSLTRKRRQIKFTENPYKTNIKRIEEYFSDLDFYKYKSNFDLTNHKEEIHL